MALQLERMKVQNRKIEYPESDGKPMAETDLHREIMFFLIHTLRRFFKEKVVYVSGNLLIYFVEGDPHRSVAPDCFVAFGVPARDRNTYKTWEEGKFPDVVFEVTSRKTRREDFSIKQPLYARLGVKEYYIYDPTRDYLKPPLQGFELIDQELVPMKPRKINGLLNSPEYVSRSLGLRLSLDSWGKLELFDAESGEQLLDNEEALTQAEIEINIQREKAQQEALRAEQETQRAQKAEQEVAQLRAQIDRLKGKSSKS